MFPTCPYCGETIEVDGEITRDGSTRLVWLGCCEDAACDVATAGFSSLGAGSLIEAFNRSTGLAAREAIEPDSYTAEFLASFPLVARVPGAGAKGWQTEVFAAVDKHHRHHDAPVGWKFGVAVYNGHALVGVAVVGRPVARLLAASEPSTLEVTRVCTWGHPAMRANASSKLYSLCGSEARRMGADKLITYTLESESGVSLRASGFFPVATTKGGTWSRASRAREDKAPICRKVRWERGLTKAKRAEVANAAMETA